MESIWVLPLGRVGKASVWSQKIPLLTAGVGQFVRTGNQRLLRVSHFHLTLSINTHENGRLGREAKIRPSPTLTGFLKSEMDFSQVGEAHLRPLGALILPGKISTILGSHFREAIVKFQIL